MKSENGELGRLNNRAATVRERRSTLLNRVNLQNAGNRS